MRQSGDSSLPFSDDHSRVKLDILEGYPHSDYVNASYIDGYNNSNGYIASQGATKVMLNDLWRLVWQANSERLVMVTNLMEGGKTKCEQYWPDKGSQTYGEISVRLINVETFADFVIRTFSITRKGETREVRQFHFTAWPDHGVPQYATSLLAFQKKVRSFDKSSKGPPVVHCSAGVGRTGTLIALNILLDQAAAEGQVDVYTCVWNLRKARTNMIQTLEQYEFVYEALLEALQSGDTALPCGDFQHLFQKLCSKDPGSGISQLQKQYEVLEGCKPKVKPEDIAAGLKPENKEKNRDENIIPAGYYRPYLVTAVQGRNEYINAVYIDAFKMKDAFIMTQLPLPDTVVDFWRLICDHQSCSIVLLEPVAETDTMCYWPTNKNEPMKFGPITVEHESTDSTDSNLVVREFKVTSTKKKRNKDMKVKQFHVQDWEAGKQVPASSASLLSVLFHHLETWQQHTENRPITVMCLDGATRSGMFCVISSMLEKVKLDQEVDVFHMVKQVRIHRPQAITNLEQYRFCHQSALDYMDRFQEYANFR